MTISYTIYQPACCGECGRPEVVIDAGEAMDMAAVAWRVQYLIEEHDLGRCHAFAVEINGEKCPLDALRACLDKLAQ